MPNPLSDRTVDWTKSQGWKGSALTIMSSSNLCLHHARWSTLKMSYHCSVTSCNYIITEVEKLAVFGYLVWFWSSLMDSSKKKFSWYTRKLTSKVAGIVWACFFPQKLQLDPRKLVVMVSALIPSPPLHSDKLICLGCYFAFKEENSYSRFQQIHWRWRMKITYSGMAELSVSSSSRLVC